MKFSTTILFILAITGAVLMTACTKSYTCQCTLKYGGTPGLMDTTQVYGITNTPTGAKSQCQSNSIIYSNKVTGNTIADTQTCILY